MGRYLDIIFEDVEPLDKQIIDYLQSLILYIKNQIKDDVKALPTEKILATVNNKFDANLDNDGFVALLNQIPFIVSVDEKEIKLSNEESPAEEQKEQEKSENEIKDTAKEQAVKDTKEESVEPYLDEFYQKLYENYKKGSN